MTNDARHHALPRSPRVTVTQAKHIATNIKLSKADPWVRSLGSTDELNSAIGLLLSLRVG